MCVWARGHADGDRWRGERGLVATRAALTVRVSSTSTGLGVPMRTSDARGGGVTLVAVTVAVQGPRTGLRSVRRVGRLARLAPSGKSRGRTRSTCTHSGRAV